MALGSQMMLLLGTLCTCAVAQTSGPATGPMPALELRLPTEERSPALALGGQEIAIILQAGGRGRVDWQLMHQAKVLQSGRIVPDARAQAKLVFIAPDVRNRTRIQIRLVDLGKEFAQEIDLLPAGVLGRQREFLKRLPLGVLDSSGQVARLLEAQNVAFEDLQPQLKRDYFDGGLLILSGFQRAAVLDDVLGRFDARIRAGMGVLIVNPPMGLKSNVPHPMPLDVPPAGVAYLAADLESSVVPGDLHLGSHRRCLATWPFDRPLVWVEGRRRLDLPIPLPAHLGWMVVPVTAPTQTSLVAARRVGKGIVVVADLPLLENCGKDPLAQTLLSEFMLWVVQDRTSSQEPLR